MDLNSVLIVFLMIGMVVVSSFGYGGNYAKGEKVNTMLFKVALSFPIKEIFHKKIISRNKHTYIMINAFNEGICVEC